MKLSALVAGGALAAAVLEGSLNPSSLVPKVTGQLVLASKIGLVEPLAALQQQFWIR